MIDWSLLDKKVYIPGEGYNGTVAETFFSEILGKENIQKGVELYINGERGGELAQRVLSLVHPWSAMNICHDIYKNDSNIEHRRKAVELLEDIGDARAIPWAKEFLNDPDERIQCKGAGLIENLYKGYLIGSTKQIRRELVLMRKHPNRDVVKAAGSIDHLERLRNRDRHTW